MNFIEYKFEKNRLLVDFKLAIKKVLFFLSIVVFNGLAYSQVRPLINPAQPIIDLVQYDTIYSKMHALKFFE